MKKLLALLFMMTLALPLTGCNTGPKEASQEEAKESMDASMTVDTMGETSGAAGTAGTTGTADPAAATPKP